MRVGRALQGAGYQEQDAQKLQGGDEIPWYPACTFGLHKLEGGGLLELRVFAQGIRRWEKTTSARRCATPKRQKERL